MKLLKLTLKGFMFLFLASFVQESAAQKAALLVPDRIEAEILKEEIKAVQGKLPVSRVELITLQKKQAMTNAAATELEETLMEALKLQKASGDSLVSLKSKSGIELKLKNIEKGVAMTETTVPRPPGGRPCLPNACLDFLYFLSENCATCDFKGFEQAKSVEFKGKTYTIYKATSKSNITTAAYLINATSYMRRK